MPPSLDRFGLAYGHAQYQHIADDGPDYKKQAEAGMAISDPEMEDSASSRSARARFLDSTRVHHEAGEDYGRENPAFAPQLQPVNSLSCANIRGIATEWWMDTCKPGTIVRVAVSFLLICGILYTAFLAVSLSPLKSKGLSLTLQRNVHSWKTRTVYHLLTDRFALSEGNGNASQCSVLSDYCGGTFNGVRDNLDYISKMGFNAIMISPVVDNAPFGYHGYWPRDFSRINSRFGTPEDLQQLVAAAHARGMLVMVDVVVNHVGCPGGGGPCGAWAAEGEAPWADVSSPFNESFAYHNSCRVEFALYDADNWQRCWLAGLPDLNQSHPVVRAALKAWISNLVRTYAFDGIRIDAGHLMEPQFVREFREAAGVFGVAEFTVQVAHDNDRLRLTSHLQDYATGVLLQSFVLAIDRAFLHKQPMVALADDVARLHARTRQPDLQGVYIDNHDLERFYGRANDSNVLRNALVLTLMSRGIPFVYYGTESGYQGQQDPWNRESLWPHSSRSSYLYSFLRTVIAFRKSVEVYKWAEQVARHADMHTYAFSRGLTLVVVTNIGAARPSHQMWRLRDHPYSPGTIVCNILVEGDCLTVSMKGLDIHLVDGEPKIYHPTADSAW